MAACISPPPRKRRRLEEEGDHPRTNQAESALSIFSWNVNGIAPFIQPTITTFFSAHTTKRPLPNVPNASLRDFLRRHAWPTLLCLQEVKIHPDDAATMQAVRQAVKKQPAEDPDAFDYEAHFCLPSDRYNARGFGRKVYGVCSIVRTDFKDRFVENIRPVDWDQEGRFLIIETKAAGLFPKLAIINVYAVNGTEYAYKDPETGEVIGTRHGRKLQVHKLLQKECQTLEAEGFGVVIAGDLNVALTPIDGFPHLRTFPKQHCLNRADFAAKFLHVPHSSSNTPTPDSQHSKQLNQAGKTGAGMIDTFRHLHPNEQAYTFYPRSRPFGESCDRVDLILLSRTLEENLVQAGMHATVAERGPSDHVPLYACLQFKDESSHTPGEAP